VGKFKFEIINMSDKEGNTGVRKRLLNRKLFLYRYMCTLLLIIFITPSICLSSTNNTLFPSLNRPLTLKWKFHSYKNGSPLIADSDTLFLPSTDGSINALEAESGKLLWRSDVGGKIKLQIVGANPKTLYVLTEQKVRRSTSNIDQTIGVIHALSEETGITRWRQSLPSALLGLTALTEGSIFCATIDNHIYSINRHTGDILWGTEELSSPSISVWSNKDTVLTATTDGHIYLFAIETGQRISDYRTHKTFISAISSLNRIIYFGSSDGYVNAMSVNAGISQTLWRRRVGTGARTISLSERGLVVTSADNFAYLLSFKNGRTRWKRLLPGRVLGEPVITSEGILFALAGDNVCVAISIGNGQRINTISVGEDNVVVAEPAIANGVIVIPTRIGLFAFAPTS
jgi:outer membrane protein assembly factor BamB